MTYPKECPVFKDRDPAFADNIYEATGFKIGNGVCFGLEAIIHSDGIPAACSGWVDINFCVPITPAAREMLAIARGGK